MGCPSFLWQPLQPAYPFFHRRDSPGLTRSDLTLESKTRSDAHHFASNRPEPDRDLALGLTQQRNATQTWLAPATLHLESRHPLEVAQIAVANPWSRRCLLPPHL